MTNIAGICIIDVLNFITFYYLAFKQILSGMTELKTKGFFYGFQLFTRPEK